MDTGQGPVGDKHRGQPAGLGLCEPSAHCPPPPWGWDIHLRALHQGESKLGAGCMGTAFVCSTGGHHPAWHRAPEARHLLSVSGLAVPAVSGFSQHRPDMPLYVEAPGAWAFPGVRAQGGAKVSDLLSTLDWDLGDWSNAKAYTISLATSTIQLKEHLSSFVKKRWNKMAWWALGLVAGRFHT